MRLNSYIAAIYLLLTTLSCSSDYCGKVESISDNKMYHNDIWSSVFYEVKLEGCEDAFHVEKLDTSDIHVNDDVCIYKNLLGTEIEKK